MSKAFDYVFKLIILGDTNTGKSCCLKYFVDGQCKYNYLYGCFLINFDMQL
jgi:hypothetical protein